MNWLGLNEQARKWRNKQANERPTDGTNQRVTERTADRLNYQTNERTSHQTNACIKGTMFKTGMTRGVESIDDIMERIETTRMASANE